MPRLALIPAVGRIRKLWSKLGTKVSYVDNGAGDYPHVRIADPAFVIKGSKLEELCSKGNVPHKEITDFLEVIEALKNDSRRCS